MMKYSKLRGIPTNYDYSKLRGRIVECFGKQHSFAAAMGIAERTMSLKLNNLSGWHQHEIDKACGILRIPCNEIHEYFFTHNTQY